jgi:Uma2 family endonuclease
MPAVLAEADQMTVEEFLAMTAARPDGERWELIEGVAVMNASPTQWHQVIVSNITHCLMSIKIERGAPWTPMIGVGTRVPISRNSLPQPDVYVQESEPRDSAQTDDALVIFEILSRSNSKSDRAWRKRVYASVPNCQHYVTISTKTAEVDRFDRADDWAGVPLKGLEATLDLVAIGAQIALRDIYRWTPIA